MPDIYLEHPAHGQKVCHSITEAQADKAHGWVEFDPAERYKPAPVVVEEPAPEEPTPDATPEPEPEMPAFLAPAPVVAPPPVKLPKPKKAEG